MNKIILIVGALLLVGCGPSQKDKNIAAVTCAVMQETRNMDAAIRVEKMNDAREKIGGEPFLRGDDAIKEAFEWRLCQELVLNESYDETLQSLKDAERERARIAREKTRIAAEKQRIAAEKRAEERKIKEEQERVAREEREALELVGTLQNLLDNQLSRIKDIEDRIDSEVQRISDSGQQDIDLKQRQISLRKQENARLSKLEEEKTNIQLRLTDARIKFSEISDREQERVAREEREALELVGTLQNLLDNQLSRIKDIEDRIDSEVQRISDSGQQDIDLKQRQIRSLSLTITEITKSLDGGGLFSNNSAKMNTIESTIAARIKAEQELEEIRLKRDQDIEDIEDYREQENARLSKLEEEKTNIQLRLTDARIKFSEISDREQERVAREERVQM